MAALGTSGMAEAQGAPIEAFLAAAEQAARARPEVDPELAREVMLEAATLLHNGLALDGLDQHDADAVVGGLCSALIAEDPGDAVRARSQSALEETVELHDPKAVSSAYLIAASILQL